MRSFISACSGAITVLGALCLIFGVISFLIGLGSGSEGGGLAGSFVAFVLIGTGLSTVLLGGTTYMLCSIDGRLEAKFGSARPGIGYNETGEISGLQLSAQDFKEANALAAAQYLADAKGNVKTGVAAPVKGYKSDDTVY